MRGVDPGGPEGMSETVLGRSVEAWERYRAAWGRPAGKRDRIWRASLAVGHLIELLTSEPDHRIFGPPPVSVIPTTGDDDAVARARCEASLARAGWRQWGPLGEEG